MRRVVSKIIHISEIYTKRHKLYTCITVNACGLYDENWFLIYLLYLSLPLTLDISFWNKKREEFLLIDERYIQLKFVTQRNSCFPFLFLSLFATLSLSLARSLAISLIDSFLRSTSFALSHATLLYVIIVLYLFPCLLKYSLNEFQQKISIHLN